MDNLEKLATSDTQHKTKTSKIKPQHNMCWIPLRHEPSNKQLEVKTNSTSFLCDNRAPWFTSVLFGLNRFVHLFWFVCLRSVSRMPNVCGLLFQLDSTVKVHVLCYNWVVRIKLDIYICIIALKNNKICLSSD
jgi:hypothetical protein